MTPDLAAEAEHLLDIVENPASLSLYRAADLAQLRRKRAEIRQRLAEWMEGAPYQPNEAVTTYLTTLAIEYRVPVRFLVEFVHDMHDDIRNRRMTLKKFGAQR